MVSFNPERLRLAREAAGLTRRELAQKAGISTVSGSKHEGGRTDPRPEVVARYAKVLGCLAEYLKSDTEIAECEAPQFRALSSLRVCDRLQAEARTRMLGELLDSHRDVLPRVNLPVPDDSLLEKIDKAEDDEPAIEHAAGLLRSTWGLGDGPVHDITGLALANGVAVSRALADRRVDAFSAWVAGRPIVVLNPAKGDGCRTRFDLGHELGHLVMHRGWQFTPSKVRERQADRFAGHFIAPRATFQAVWQNSGLGADPTSPAQLLPLKRFFGLSIGACVFRASSVGCIDDARKTALFRALGAMGWRRREPVTQEPETGSIERWLVSALDGAGWAKPEIERSFRAHLVTCTDEALQPTEASPCHKAEGEP